MKTANELIKEIEEKFKATGIEQVKKGTGQQQRDNIKNNNKNNSNSTETKKTN